MSKTERTLTERESARKKRIDGIAEELAQQGYVRKDQIISIVFANVMAILLSIPFMILFGVWFLIHNAGIHNGFPWPGFLLILALIPVHEGIHGITWGLCAPSKFKTIEFGFMVKELTPYCTCGEPLKKGQYILGSIMPGLLLGFLPCIVAVFANSFFLLLIGILMIMAAGGDMTIVLKMLFYRSDSKDIIIMDHPTECGFIVFER